MTKNLTKTTEEINIMRENGKILNSMLEKLSEQAKAGVNTMELEKEFIKMCKKEGARPACKGYAPFGMPPFPTGLCISINSDSVHCFPKKSKTLKEGDIVTIDTVIEKNGYYVDAARSKVIGKTKESRIKLVETAKLSVYNAIEKIRPGIKTGDLSNEIYTTVKKAGFDVLRDYAGHGIGKSMHEDPEIACYGKAGTGTTLEEGMTICVESLICEGNPELMYKSEWETSMRDGKDWVQFEHTVLVTKEGYEIITI